MSNTTKKSTIEIVKLSAKGAALITDDGGKTKAWVRPATAKALEAGKESKAARKALDERRADVKFDESLPYRIWQKSFDEKTLLRFYWKDKENSYIQIEIVDRAPRGRYEAHRYSKGEQFKDGFLRHENIEGLKEKIDIILDHLMNSFAIAQHLKLYLVGGTEAWEGISETSYDLDQITTNSYETIQA